MQKTLDSIHRTSCTYPSRDRALEHFTALKFPKSTLASIIFEMEEITGTPPRSGHLINPWLSCIELVKNKVAEGQPSLQGSTSLSYQVARQNLSTSEGPPGFWQIIKKSSNRTLSTEPTQCRRVLATSLWTSPSQILNPHPNWQGLRGSAEKNGRISPNPGEQRLWHQKEMYLYLDPISVIASVQCE